MAAIGAQSTYAECPTGPYAKIVATGDEARSFLDPLAEVVQAGINVMIWAGDLGEDLTPLFVWPFQAFLQHSQGACLLVSQLTCLDWICNWYGSQLVVNNLNYSDSTEFQATALEEYTVDGVSYGQYKSVGNLNFLRVYEAGHEVPYYREFSFPLNHSFFQKPLFHILCGWTLILTVTQNLLSLFKPLPRS